MSLSSTSLQYMTKSSKDHIYTVSWTNPLHRGERKSLLPSSPNCTTSAMLTMLCSAYTSSHQKCTFPISYDREFAHSSYKPSMLRQIMQPFSSLVTVNTLHRDKFFSKLTLEGSRGYPVSLRTAMCTLWGGQKKAFWQRCKICGFLGAPRGSNRR